MFLKDFLGKKKKFQQNEFNLDLLVHVNHKRMKDFLNLVYQNGMILSIDKPTRVTRKKATAINHVSQTLLWIELLN